MNELKIIRENGNVPKSLPGEDHVSGFIAYMTSGELPAQFKSEHIHSVSTIDAAESLGITADAPSWTVKVLHYQLSEIFRVNPTIILYVGLYTKPQSTYDFAEIKAVQNYAGGSIRQMAVWCGDKALAAEDITAIQGVADALDEENAPLSVLYAPKVEGVSKLSTDLAGAGKSRVSVVISQAGSGLGAELFQANEDKPKSSVSTLGVILGLLSRAAVHQSISWVKNFPTGVSVPAFGDGTLFRNLDKGDVAKLDKARYIFLVTQVGQSGSYVNDSHTMDAAISDYAMIENVRVMDKAVRGIRTYLIPELGGSLYIDASTGKLQPYSVTHLETMANKALEDMEKAGELSGFKVEIDPEQDVLSTSTVEIVIKQVAVGVMRRIKVKIGYAKSV